MSRTHRIAIGGMLLGWSMALSPLAAAGEAAEVAAPATQPDYPQMLGQAMQGIQQGNPGKAIEEYLDPIIADFEPRAAQSQGRMFSASSMMETVMYAAMGAGLDKAQGKDKATGGDTVVVDGAWSTALHLKGYALIDLERYEEAKVVLKRGTEIAPLHPLMWSELGAIYQLEKKWPEALAAYQKAEEGAGILFTGEKGEVNVLLTRALRGHGFVLIETGELKKAEKIYKRVLKLDPADSGAKRELAYIEDMKRNKKK